MNHESINEYLSTYLMKTQNSDKSLLKKFLFSSISITRVFFENFFTGEKEVSLKNYAKFLNEESVSNVIKLFAIQDLKVFNERLNESIFYKGNDGQFEKDVFQLLSFNEKDAYLYKTLSSTKENYAKVFNNFFLSYGLEVSSLLNISEEEFFKDTLEKRKIIFSEIFIPPGL